MIFIIFMNNTQISKTYFVKNTTSKIKKQIYSKTLLIILENYAIIIRTRYLEARGWKPPIKTKASTQ